MNMFSAKEAAQRWGISERMVRKYCVQKRIPTAVLKDGIWYIPENETKPERKITQRELPKGYPKRVAYQRKKNNHYGIYEYIQVNLAYSSSRMASNRLTREQVMEIFRTGKVSLAFEPMKIDDLVEISNHFLAGKFMVDTITEPVTAAYIRRLHQKLFSGTQAALKGTLHVGEYRKTPDKFGVDADIIPATLKALVTEYENKENITMYDILNFHARFEKVHPFEDGNGRTGRILIVKESLRHGVDPFIIDDKHRSAYNQGIANWSKNPTILTAVAEQAQARFRNVKETLDLMNYCRPPHCHGSR